MKTTQAKVSALILWACLLLPIIFIFSFFAMPDRVLEAIMERPVFFIMEHPVEVGLGYLAALVTGGVLWLFKDQRRFKKRLFHVVLPLLLVIVACAYLGAGYFQPA
jgi:hypothetical protein